MTDQYGCVKQIPSVYVIGTGTPTVGMEGILVFPNPMTDLSRVVHREPMNGGTRIELLDFNGRVVRVLFGNGTREIPIEHGHVESGLYVLRVMRGGEHLGSARIVIQ